MNYALVIYSDGDARVHDRDKMQVGDKVVSMYSDMTMEIVQVSDDKDLLIKIANMARADYVQRYKGTALIGGETYVLNSVDQTTNTIEERMKDEQPTN